ncbi:MAG: type I-E CRISPR-associated protein Cse2/CasB [Deinococcales bacterium]
MSGKHEAFIQQLERFHQGDERQKPNRKALAELRRSLGFELGTYIPAYSYVESFHPSNFDRPMYYLVAGLYALHPQHTQAEESFGQTLVKVQKEKEQISESLEKRFLALLNCQEENQLAHHLRQMIGIVKQAEVNLNYVKLLRDLIKWNSDDRYIQRHWAQDYYQGLSPQKPSSDENAVETLDV